MKLFVDTADTAEIKSLVSSGILDGATTNPSLVARTGKKFTDIIREICNIIARSVSAEVAATDYDGRVREAFVPSEIARNVTITVRRPMHVVEAAKPAHVATLPPPVLRSLFNHPLTGKGLAAFLAARGQTGQTIAGSDDRLR
jgi:hypothetical protein